MLRFCLSAGMYGNQFYDDEDGMFSEDKRFVYGVFGDMIMMFLLWWLHLVVVFLVNMIIMSFYRFHHQDTQLPSFYFWFISHFYLSRLYQHSSRGGW